MRDFYQQHMTQDVTLLQKNLAGKCYLLQGLPLEVSAVDLRARLQQNVNVDFLLPSRVVEYLQKEKIYCA